MLLFRGDFGCLLYTGDFRWEASNERAEIGRNTLVKALKDDVVDILYLDNTYCNPSYAFPSREVAAQQVHFLNFSPAFFFVYSLRTFSFTPELSTELKIKMVDEGNSPGTDL